MSVRIFALLCLALALGGCEKKSEPLTITGTWWGIEGSVADNATLDPLGGTHVRHRSASTGYMTASTVSDSGGMYSIRVPGTDIGPDGDLEFDKEGYTIAVFHLPGRANLIGEGRYRLDVVLSR